MIINIKVVNANIEQFESYLHEIKSIAVDFIQIDSIGNIIPGKLLIKKPYKFRFNYYPPYPLLIIGNEKYVSIYDYDMDHTSRIKSKENIFNFLLMDKMDYTKHFNIESIIENKDIITIKLHHFISANDSEITFNKHNKQMQTMRINDGSETITLQFSNITKVVNFDDDLFNLKNSDIFGAPARFDKIEIEKKYR